MKSSKKKLEIYKSETVFLILEIKTDAYIYCFLALLYLEVLSNKHFEKRFNCIMTDQIGLSRTNST